MSQKLFQIRYIDTIDIDSRDATHVKSVPMTVTTSLTVDTDQQNCREDRKKTFCEI